MLAASTPSDAQVLTTVEAAVLLRCHPSTLRREASRGRIPHRRLGRRYLFSRSALLAWLTSAENRDTGEPTRPDEPTVDCGIKTEVMPEPGLASGAWAGTAPSVSRGTVAAKTIENIAEAGRESR